MKKLGVLVSGAGTNLQALLEAAELPGYPAAIALVISNISGVRALDRARQSGIPALVVPHQGRSREDFERELITHLEKAGVDLVVLAGFMRVLSPVFVRHYKGRLINIHPALLPSFPGTRAIDQAWNYGAKVTGVTVHFVDEGMDTGPIILQKEVPIDERDDLSSLERKIHQVEHQIYPEAVRLVALGRATMPESPERRVRLREV